MLTEREIEVFTRAECICSNFVADLRLILSDSQDGKIETVSLSLLDDLMKMAERTENVVWETKYALQRALNRVNSP